MLICLLGTWPWRYMVFKKTGLGLKPVGVSFDKSHQFDEGSR